MGRLEVYLRRNAGLGFDWAGHNCLSFVSGALVATGRSRLPEDWTTGYATQREAVAAYRAMLRRYGHRDIVEAFDARLTRAVTLHPRDGAVVARKSDDLMGYAFGVVHRGLCFHVGREYLMVTRPEVADLYWT